MQDLEILNSYLGFRWALHQSNQTSSPRYFLIDKFVLNNLIEGDSCCLDDIPDFYKYAIKNLDSALNTKYSNIICINSIALSYKKFEDIFNFLLGCRTFLNSPGRIILSLTTDNLIYDRVNLPIEIEINFWIKELSSSGLNCILWKKIDSAPYGYGNLFFVFGHG